MKTVYVVVNTDDNTKTQVFLSKRQLADTIHINPNTIKTLPKTIKGYVISKSTLLDSRHKGYADINKYSPRNSQ